MAPVSIKHGPAQGKPLTVRIDANLDRRLQTAAASEGLSVSDFVREAITERLDRGAVDSSLWEHCSKRRQAAAARSGEECHSAAEARRGAHAEFAAGLEADAASKWVGDG